LEYDPILENAKNDGLLEDLEPFDSEKENWMRTNVEVELQKMPEFEQEPSSPAKSTARRSHSLIKN
jgi:hypothetical protein